MSRRRTGLRPQDWYIEEPATHVARQRPSGGAAIGGIFVVGRSTAQKHAEEAAAYKARLAEKAPLFVERRKEPRPVCGKPLPYVGEPCARTPGHLYDCRSSMALASKREANAPARLRPTLRVENGR